MTEIQYKDLSAHMEKDASFILSPIYFLYGDEFLFKTALQGIVDKLLPEESHRINCIVLNGATDSLVYAIEQINTFTLFSSKKVIVFHDAKIFVGNENEAEFLEKAKNAYTAQQQKKSSGYILKWVALKGLSKKDLEGDIWKKVLPKSEEKEGQTDWLEDVVHHILSEDLKIPSVEDEASLLMQSLEKGFPDGHHFIITSDSVKRKHPLFQIISDRGIIVDCSVAKGQTRADLSSQTLMLKDLFKDRLESVSKKAGAGVFEAIFDLTGFDLRLFTQNIEKLITYVGAKPRINLEDVHFILTRSKKDPIFEFTNAVTDRNLDRSVFYLSSLIMQNFAYLQILAAMVNQFRKLILIKDFILTNKGNGWKQGAGFDIFKANIFPQMKSSDEKFLENLSEWHEAFSVHPAERRDKLQKKRARKVISSDLLVAKGATNPYPLYLMFKKSDRFDKKELLLIYERLMEADISLKSQASSHKLVLERVILFICLKDSKIRK